MINKDQILNSLIKIQQINQGKLAKLSRLTMVNAKVQSKSLEKLICFKFKEIENTIVFPGAIYFKIPLLQDFNGQIKIGVIEIEQM